MTVTDRQSLCPVLRINVEVQDEKCGYVELNTAVEKMETVKRMAGTEEKYSC